jgi:peptidoglycan/LPS O-acetylase OafA/YrhL
MQSPAGSARINSIDGYRAFAILAVILHHVRYSPGYPQSLQLPADYVPPGVTAFWLLSGFLITRSLLRDEQKYGAVRFGQFYARQGIRYFVPLIAYLIGIGILIAIRFPGGDWRAVLHPLFLDPNTYCVSTRISHLYSLVLQIYFWLSWPIILRILPNRSRLPLAMFLCAIAFVWRAYGEQRALELGTCPGRVDYYFASLLLGACFALGQNHLRKFATFRFAWPIALSLFVLALLVGLSRIFGYFSSFFIAFAWGLLVFALANNLLPRIGRLLSFPGLTWLGRISLSLYLWQNIFCFGLSGTFLDRFPINIPAAIALGYLAYRLIELPSLRWRSKIKPRSALSPAAIPELRAT